MTRQELIDLSGQIANGILSSEGNWLGTIAELKLHKKIAETCVTIAQDILTIIDEKTLSPPLKSKSYPKRGC